MNNRLHNFSRARRATTLVEVIAGLVILGTILSSMLIARGRFVRQESQAQRKLQAVEAIDGLVACWMSGPSGAVPLRSSGSLDGAPGQTWHTRLLPNSSAEALGARMLRVDVFDPSQRGPLITLDLLLPIEIPAEATP